MTIPADPPSGEPWSYGSECDFCRVWEHCNYWRRCLRKCSPSELVTAPPGEAPRLEEAFREIWERWLSEDSNPAGLMKVERIARDAFAEGWRAALRDVGGTPAPPPYKKIGERMGLSENIIVVPEADSPPVRPEGAAPPHKGTCNPFTTECGAKFCAYEDMAAHTAECAAEGASHAREYSADVHAALRSVRGADSLYGSANKDRTEVAARIAPSLIALIAECHERAERCDDEGYRVLHEAADKIEDAHAALVAQIEALRPDSDRMADLRVRSVREFVLGFEEFQRAVLALLTGREA